MNDLDQYLGIYTAANGLRSALQERREIREESPNNPYRLQAAEDEYEQALQEFADAINSVIDARIEELQKAVA